MSLIALLTLLLNISMGLVVLGFGLKSSLVDALYLLKRPVLLVRSILSMNIAMPVIAILMVAMFNLPIPLKIAIIAISLSPVPPFLPKLQAGGGGEQGYILSLLAIAAILSIIIVPNGVWLIGEIFNVNGAATAINIIPTILITTLIPLLVGEGLRQFTPDIADRIARPVALIGTALMVFSLLPILFFQWSSIVSMVGNGTLLILAIFSGIGLAAGHYFGVGDPDRGVLALATAIRHPGVAITIAHAAFPEETGVLAVVLWHLIVGALLSLAYLRFRPHAKASPRAAHT